MNARDKNMLCRAIRLQYFTGPYCEGCRRFRPFLTFFLHLMIPLLSFVLLNKTLNMNEGDRPSQVGSQNIEV